MLKLRTISYMLVILLLVASTSESYTKVGRTKKKNKYKSTMEYSPIKYNLVAQANLGFITDDENNFRSFYKPNNKYYYGVGIAFEYHTEGKFAFGIHYDRLMYDYGTVDFDNDVTVQVYSISTIYKFRTKKTTIPIASIQYGTAVPDYDGASNAKSLKFGLGFIGHTAGKMNLRGLFYYQQFFSNDELSLYLADGKLNVVGLDVSIGLPL